MMAILVVVGCFCFIIWLSNPGLLGNLFIWIFSIGIMIAAAYWLGFGGFLIAAAIAGWGAYSVSSTRQQEINAKENARITRLRREKKNWMHY